MFSLTVGLRMTVYSTDTAVGGALKFGVVGSPSSSSVLELLDQDSCWPESKFLCPGIELSDNDEINGATCLRTWGYPLGALLHVHDQRDARPPFPNVLNCSVAAQFRMIPRESLQSFQHEQATLEYILRRSIVNLYQSRTHTRMTHSTLSRLLEFTIRSYFCRVVTHENSSSYTREVSGGFTINERMPWGRIFSTDATLWTPDVFSAILHRAIESITTEIGVASSPLPMQAKDTHLLTDTAGASSHREEPMSAVDFIHGLERIQRRLTAKIVRGECSHMCSTYPVYMNMTPNGPFSLFFSQSAIKDRCMFLHYQEHRTILSFLCWESIQKTLAAVNDSDAEGYFLEVYHGVFLAAHLIFLLILFVVATSRKRIERRMDRTRFNLEHELEEDVLRHSLQNQTTRDLVNQADQESFIRRVAAWDGKAAAGNTPKQYIRKFRLLVLLTMASSSVVYYAAFLFGEACMCYLDLMSISTAILLYSYASPLA